MNAEQFLKYTSPNDRFGVRASLKHFRLYRLVVNIMERYAEHRMNTPAPHVFSVGKQIFFTNEKLPYKVMAISERYAVVSRKLDKREDSGHLRHQVKMSAYSTIEEAYTDNRNVPVYSLLDFKENKRSSDNLVFRVFDYFDEEDCRKAIEWLESGQMELSRRNAIELSIDSERTTTTSR